MPRNNPVVDLLTGKSAADATGIAVVPKEYVQRAGAKVVTVRFNAGSAAGVVLVEAADADDFSGTWATIATINWAAASRCHEAAISGPHIALRVRISSAITGGSVDVKFLSTE